MTLPLRVLIVEDSEADSQLLLRELSRGNFDLSSHRIQTAEEMVLAFAGERWDIVISDYSLPHFSAPEALKLIRESEFDLPFIVVSGQIGEEIAVEMMRSGARNYVMKNNLVRLLPVVEGELERVITLRKALKKRAHVEAKLKATEEKYRTLFANMFNGLAFCRMIYDEGGSPVDWVYLEVNDAFEKITGLRREKILGSRFTEVDPETYKAHPELLRKYGAVAANGEETSFDIFSEPLNVWLHISAFSPQTNHFCIVFEDITVRKKMEKQLINVSTKEQQRIGQDLHDGLGQELTGIALKLKVLERIIGQGSVPEVKKVKEIGKLLSNAIDATRNLARVLYPVELERLGLKPALEELINHVEMLYGIPCKLRVDSAAKVDTETVAIQVYRIAQEAINNAAKHSGASKIWITLAKVDELVVLTVDDDGKGIPGPSDRDRGLGLSIMMARANQIDATMQILQSEKTGTQVKCEIPLIKTGAQ